ncbi:MAG: DUF885 family protein [Hyphomonadaceae bacterium]
MSADAQNAPSHAAAKRRIGGGAWAKAAAALAFVLLAACSPKERQEPLSAFSGRVEDWTREIVRDSPELASDAALPADYAGPYTDKLDDRSAAAEERRRARALRYVVELRGFDRETLTPAERVTYDVLSDSFAVSADLADFAFGDFGGQRPYVLDQQASAFINLPDFLDARHPIANLQDAENYNRRLNAAAAAIDAELARARADAEAGIIPPDFIISRTLTILDGMNGTPLAEQTYLSSLRRKLDALFPPPAEGAPVSADRRRAQNLYAQAEAIVRDRIVPAQQRTAQFLRSIYPRATHEAGIGRLPNGPAYYAALLRAQTTTPLTPEEIHTIGLARVRALNADADVALRRVGLTEGAVGQRLAQLTADPRYRYPETEEGRAQLIADVRARVNTIMSRAPQWFAVLPRAPLEVRRVPAAIEAAAPGAYYESPALDGSHPGVYYVNLRNMAEMTRIDLPTQDFHEAVPGHHFQTALAQEQEGLPLIRRLSSFNAYQEGWALYAEQLADENNLYADDHIGRIGYLRWQLWRAARLVVDTGIHAKGWSREQAVDYMTQTTGDAVPIIVTEIERYAASPAQACGYELGRREIVRLRDEARRALGRQFDLRAFHRVVLTNGAVPLTVLERIVREWIAEERH